VEVGTYKAASGTQTSTAPLAGNAVQAALSPGHAAVLTADGKLCGLVLGESNLPRSSKLPDKPTVQPLRVVQPDAGCEVDFDS